MRAPSRANVRTAMTEQMAKRPEGLFVIQIPTQNLAGGGADMRSRLQTWEWRTNPPKWAREAALDFTNVHFIEPWALALFTSYGLMLKQEHRIPVRAILDSWNPSNNYIAQMGLEHVLHSGTSTPEWDDSAQNTGLHVIRTHQDVTRFVQSASNLGISPSDETIDALKYGMAELARNVVQHSLSPIGGVAIAQYFPDRRAIQISISDCGRGIYQSLRTTYPELQNHLESLKLAVLPHVSGAFRQGVYSASENAGLGLFFVKEICWRSGGSFWLASQNSLLGVQENDESGKTRIYRTIQPWNGTSVTMDLPETGVVDFAALLGICRELASNARQSSGPAGLDFLTDLPEMDDIIVIKVGEFDEDVEKAALVRDNEIMPNIRAGNMIVLDFSGTRFVTQSFVHALLNDAFRLPGSLVRLSFVNCTKSSEEAIAAVAAYAASYAQCIE